MIAQPWFPWSPITSREMPALPGGAQAALAVVIDLRAVEWDLDRTLTPVVPPGGRGVAPPPDYPRVGDREYGHRVGIFRLLGLLADRGIRPAVALDVLTAEHYPRLVDLVRPQVSTAIAGGLSASRPITSLMTEDEEGDYIAMTLDRLEAAWGERPGGWLGPEHSESFRTPALLAEAGTEYLCDWGNDEAPYPMSGAGAGLWALPMSWELSDLSAVHLRGVAPRTYAESVVRAFDVLVRDVSPRCLVLHLHPWIAGRPTLAAELARALDGIARDPRWWVTSPTEIIAWARGNPTGRG